MRISHAPRAARRVEPPGRPANIAGPHAHPHWHIHAPHIDWGHVAAGMVALMLAIVVMWFFAQP